MDVALNWLWQGALVACVAAAALRVIGSSRPHARYLVLWAALLSVLAMPVAPFVWIASLPRVAETVPAPVVGLVVSIPSAWWASSAFLLGLWAVWSSVYAGRVTYALLALRRAKACSQQIPAALEARLRCWTQVKAKGRATRVVMSSRVSSAAVLGCGSPLVAVSPMLFDALGDDDLDRVVIHEWAHIQRRDDLANLAQVLVRVVAGWHPAVWWLDQKLRLERESACDAMAVTVTGSARDYAACLATLASLPLRSAPAVAVSATSNLHDRLVRVLSRGRVPSSSSRWVTRIAAGAVLGVTVLAIGGFRFADAGVSLTEAGTTLVAARAAIETVASTALAPAVQRGVLAKVASGAGRPSVKSARQAPRRSLPTSASGVGLTEVSASHRPEGAESASPPEQSLVPAARVGSTVVLAALESSPPSVTADAVPAVMVAELPAAMVNRAPPWGAAAEAGVAVGRSSQRAALATASVFTRFGMKIAGSF